MADTREAGGARQLAASVSAGDGEGEGYRLPDLHFEGPNLDLPGPPEDLPYDRVEDWRSEALLAVNDIGVNLEGLAGALHTEDGVLLAAAAHAAAAFPDLASLLRQVAQGQDDLAAVEAAYALARLGHDDGVAALHDALDRPAGPYLSPVLAAGYLARIGSPSGYHVVRKALGSELLAVRMLACKQLAFFAPFHGTADAGGEVIDVFGAFERSLADEDPSIQGQALTQLQWLGSPLARPIVEPYLGRVEDRDLAELARATLARHPEG